MRESKFLKGWFWFCPIYFRKSDNTLMARHWLLDWLFYIVLLLHQSMLFVAHIFEVDIEPVFPIKITEK